jgi:hypothetical protein
VLTSELTSSLLLAVITAHGEAARQLLAQDTRITDVERKVLVDVLDQDADPATTARLIGDRLRELPEPWDAGELRDRVNECYRVAFHCGPDWKAQLDNPLYDFFLANRSGAIADKWMHYLAIYHRHLARFRDRPVRVLEIGVYRGGGMDMWSWYFGPRATVVGVDIDPVTLDTVGRRHTVVLGDQSDPGFLTGLAREHGPFDVIIDDGGHTMQQQIVSAETLYPLLADDGVYLVEDCHTSYWPAYGGGLRDPGSFIEWAKNRVDDVNGYHIPGQHVVPTWTTHVDGVHFYDSVVVFEKHARYAPFSEQTGSLDYVAKARPAEAFQAEVIANQVAAFAERDRAVAKLERVELELGLLRAQGVSGSADGTEEDAAQAARGADEVARSLLIAKAELDRTRPRLSALEQEVEELRLAKDAAEAELATTNARLAQSFDQVKHMRTSTSWRITVPLRRLWRR